MTGRAWVACQHLVSASVDERDGFSASHSGLSLFNHAEHAFTEIQACPLSHAPVEGISELAHLDGELA